MNDELRKQVRLLKALQKITYKEIAEEYLEVSKNSFANWLNGYYNFSTDKLHRLQNIINDLTE